MNNERRESLSNLSEYEDILSLELVEVEGDRHGDQKDEKVVPVEASKENDDEEVRKKLLDQIKEKYWWFQDYWKEKGKPSQQIRIVDSGEVVVDVYNFGNDLDQEQVDEIISAISLFGQVNRECIDQQIYQVLIDNKQTINPKNGKPYNGDGPLHGDRTVKLYPNGVKMDQYRISDITNIRGTVIHEMAHGLNNGIENEWIMKFGWHKKKASGYYTDNPEKCVTDYANIDPSKDISESIVAALCNPEKLDPKKLKFIQDKILSGNAVATNLSSQILKDQSIQLPRVGKPIKFSRVDLINIDFE